MKWKVFWLFSIQNIECYRHHLNQYLIQRPLKSFQHKTKSRYSSTSSMVETRLNRESKLKANIPYYQYNIFYSRITNLTHTINNRKPLKVIQWRKHNHLYVYPRISITNRIREGEQQKKNETKAQTKLFVSSVCNHHTAIAVTTDQKKPAIATTSTQRPSKSSNSSKNLWPKRY